MGSKVFCGGTLCRKTDRINKCFKCGRYACNGCSLKVLDKVYCVDCGIDVGIDMAFDYMEKKSVDVFAAAFERIFYRISGNNKRSKKENATI